MMEDLENNTRQMRLNEYFKDELRERDVNIDMTRKTLKPQKNRKILPDEGYLTNKKKTLSSENEGDKRIETIRGKEIVKFIPPEQYIINKDKIEDKNNKKRMRISNNENDITLVGDPLTMNDEWLRKPDKVRIIFQNVGGLCPIKYMKDTC